MLLTHSLSLPRKPQKRHRLARRRTERYLHKCPTLPAQRLTLHTLPPYHTWSPSPTPPLSPTALPIASFTGCLPKWSLTSEPPPRYSLSKLATMWPLTLLPISNPCHLLLTALPSWSYTVYFVACSKPRISVPLHHAPATIARKTQQHGGVTKTDTVSWCQP